MPPPALPSIAQLTLEVHVWHVDPAAISAPEVIETCAHWLDSDERSRWHAFKTAALQHDFLVAHALCRGVLSHYTNEPPQSWQFTRGVFGKPALHAPRAFSNLRFNLSHTQNLALVALTVAKEIGVDAEQIREEVDQEIIARHFFSPADRVVLASSVAGTQRETFFNLWVMKEAYLKGIGEGLTRSPETFTVPYDGQSGTVRFEGWQLACSKPTPKHVAAVAVKESAGDIPVRWFEGIDLFPNRGG
jgi:4'-phosphopantetheinyl transferase